VAILREHGYAKGEIAALVERRVVRLRDRA